MAEPEIAAAIREAEAADAEAIAALWTEAYVTRGVGGRSKPYAPADFFRSAESGEVFVVDAAARPTGHEHDEGSGSEPGGIAGAVVLLAPGAHGRAVARGEEAELARLAVAFPARRTGIGRALTLFCVERARAAGWKGMALWSRRGQVEAHRLYESLGFRRAPERDSVDQTGHARLVFRLAL